MTKSHRLKSVMALALVLSPVILRADEPGKATTGAKKNIYYRVYKPGYIDIFESTMMVAQVVPVICKENWDCDTAASPKGSSENRDGYTWKTILDNGVAVDLKTEVNPLPGGFHIRYTLAPRASLKMERVRTVVSLVYPGWRGAPYQFESNQGKIPENFASKGTGSNEVVIQETDSPFFSLGPSQDPYGLQMHLIGTKGCQLTLLDDPDGPDVFITDPGPSSGPWEWKAGEKKTFDFSLAFDPPAAWVEPVQEPQRPFPYQEEEVNFFSTKDHVKLAGTLTLPKGKGPFPAVVLIHPSGQVVGSWLGGHNIFLVLSDYLTRHGIAVLRYDKRGCGDSGGNFQTATEADFAEDALAGFEYLRGRKEIDPKKVGLIGHSEGGAVAPMVAAKSKDVAFIVLMAGSGAGYKSEDKIGMDHQWKEKGLSDAFTSLGNKVYDQIVGEVLKTQDLAQAKVRINRIIQDGADQAKKDFPKEFDSVLWSTWFDADYYSTSNERFELNYDPEKTFKSVSCPVLAIAGDKNWIIPNVCWPAIEKDLKEGNNPELTFKLLPGVNHMFQTCKTDSQDEWAPNPNTVAPQALESITDWITDHTK